MHTYRFFFDELFMFRFNTILLLYLNLINQTCFSQSQWQFMHPLPTGNRLNSVSFYYNTFGYSAGSNGTIIRTDDGGITWSVEQPGICFDINKILFVNKNKIAAFADNGIILLKSHSYNSWSIRKSGSRFNLTDAVFVSDKIGFAAGLGGTIIKTTDGGLYWKKINTGTNASLSCIDFTDMNTGVCGGYNVILKTTDGGLNWFNLNVNGSPPAQFIDIKMFPDNTVYALYNSPHGKFYASSGGGYGWSIHSLNLPHLFDGTVDLVRSFSFQNKNNGLIVTDLGTILITSNGGVNWRIDSSFRPSVEKSGTLRDVYVSDSANTYFCGGGGTVLKSTGDGKFRIVLTGNFPDINSICFINEQAGFAACEGGKIGKTTNSGSCWIFQKISADNLLSSVEFANGQTGFIGGNNGTLLKSIDAGENWFLVNGITGSDIKDIEFINSSTGFFCTGETESGIFKTTNEGVNWTKVFESTEISTLNSINFINDNTGFCGGHQGYVLKTINGGLTWSMKKVSPDDINSISFQDEHTGFAAGDGGFVFRTTDAGINWEYTFSGVYKNLKCIKSIYGQNLIAAGVEGTIIYSTDSGISWLVSRQITQNTIKGISHSAIGSKNENPVLCGEYGTVLKCQTDFSRLNPLISPFSSKISNIPQKKFETESEYKYGISDYGGLILKIFDVTGKETGSYKIENNFTGNLNSVTDLRKYIRNKSLTAGIYFYAVFINEKFVGSGKLIHLNK